MRAYIRIILIALTVLSLVDSAVPARAATKSGSCGENGSDAVTWTLTDDGVITFSGTGDMDNWTEDIQTPWASYSDSIKKAVVAGNVTSIGSGAFLDCRNLTEISVSGSVTDIQESAFENCIKLKSIRIPGTVKYIGKTAFLGCSTLSAVTIESGVESIGDSVFENCDIVKITFPNSITEMGEAVLCGNENLTSVVLPDKLGEIGTSMFMDCPVLTSVKIPDSVTSIWNSAFENCVLLEKLTIPKNVSMLGEHVFENCISLEAIVLPASIEDMGEGVFQGCTSLKTVTFKGSLPEMEDEKVEFFKGLTAAAYYPDTWKKVPSAKEYGGTITWVPYSTKTGKKGEAKVLPKFKIDVPSYEVVEGKSIQLQVPAGYDPKYVVWEFKNPKTDGKIAKITKTGKLIFKKNTAGKRVVVVVRYSKGKAQKQEEIILSSKKAARKSKIKGATKIKAGKKAKLKVVEQYTGNKKEKIIKNDSIRWKCLNPKYASVKNGVVKTKKTGKGRNVRITAYLKDGSKKTLKTTIKLK